MERVADIRQYFSISPIQRARDLESAGWSRAELSRMASQGLLRRLRRGVYCLPDYLQSEDGDLLIVAKRNPEALMCLLTALRLHGLTTQMPSEIWLGLPNKARIPRLEYPALRVIRFSPASLDWGVETRLIEGIPLRITNIEKTIADCFKYRARVGLDVALEALREARRKGCLDRDALWACAKIDRVTTVIQPYLEALA